MSDSTAQREQLHVQPVKNLGLRLLVLDNLQHLVARLPIRQARDANVRHQIPRNLAGIQRILAADPELSRGRLGLQPPRPHDGPIHPRRPQVPLRDDLLVEHPPEGVGDDESRGLLLSPLASVGEDGGDHDHLLDAGGFGGVDELAGADVVDLVGGFVHFEGIAGDEAHCDDKGLGSGEGRCEGFGGVGDIHLPQFDSGSIQTGNLLHHRTPHDGAALPQTLLGLFDVAHSRDHREIGLAGQAFEDATSRLSRGSRYHHRWRCCGSGGSRSVDDVVGIGNQGKEGGDGERLERCGEEGTTADDGVVAGFDRVECGIAGGGDGGREEGIGGLAGEKEEGGCYFHHGRGCVRRCNIYYSPISMYLC
mmetsp:Transcript_31562/g.66083  ORF Transcript_31562/g.66083 Transcript_31562/m.66083 type:complete len:364 (-) Transcript_31562:196-1287(-)